MQAPALDLPASLDNFLTKGTLMGFFNFLRPGKGARARTATPPRPQLSVEGLESRVVPYALSGTAWPHPEMVTISFVPDGTVLGSNANGFITSNLFSSFTSKFGSDWAWQSQVLKAAQAWAQQTNINFAVVPDDGADIGAGDFQQGAPTHGDIRIGGYNFGTATLAQAYVPPPMNNYSIAGDLQFNTGKTWNINNTYDIATVALHEIGHSLGLYHSPYSTAAM
ncbi:MAG TPA: matrixin family metalloprotease, partial [Gemmataceae bacterium]|nr:matrixin family metalloprotease [Gemmataceae bacterium]